MKKLFILLFVACSVHAGAQMDSCNVFLQAHHVEIGIAPIGSYGSSVSQPPGYHGNMTTGSYYFPCGHSGGHFLGFVADPDKDGWTVGTPAYMGDYFLPGTPFEGWELQIGSGICQAINTEFDTAGFMGTLTATGGNISYSSTWTNITSVWQGTVDSVGVTQVTSIDTGSLFFTTRVTFTNYSSAPINNMYYLRTLDPDNDEKWPGGGFITTNTILHQVSDTTVVTATGATGAISMLALGTTDTNAHCLVYQNWPISDTVSLSALYNETYTDPGTIYTQGATNTADFAIGLVYHIAHLASVDSAADSVYRTTSVYGRHPANTATITFFYAFGQAGLDSALTQLSDTQPSLGIRNVNAFAPITVYPNPSTGIINVTGLNTGDHLSVTDMMGRTTNLAGIASGTGRDKFSVSEFVMGNYILNVKDADGNLKSRVKFQKQ